MMKMAVFLSKTSNHSQLMIKTSDKTQKGGKMTVSVIKNKESLRNCRSQEEPKEAW